MKKLAAIAIACTLCAAASAQIPQLVTARFNQIPVEDALARVFQPLHMKYQVKPDVKGTVSVDAVRTQFSDVLRDILTQSDCISEMVDGTYTIRPIQHPVQAQTMNLAIPSWMKLDRVGYNEADVRLVLKELLGLGSVKYTIAPEVQGVVTLELRNVSLEVAIRNVLKQVGATYKVGSRGLEIGLVEWQTKSELPRPSP